MSVALPFSDTIRSLARWSNLSHAVCIFVVLSKWGRRLLAATTRQLIGAHKNDTAEMWELRTSYSDWHYSLKVSELIMDQMLHSVLDVSKCCCCVLKFEI